MPDDTRVFYDFGPFSLDPSARILWRDGKIVDIEPRALKVLVVLIKAKGELVEKESLITLAWGEDVSVTQNSLYNAITLLRKALRAPLDGQECIETIPARGYCFT